MPAVKLLLKEKFGEEAVLLDLFGAPLNVDDGADSSELVAETNLSTTQFNVKFEGHTKFPSVDKEDVEVSATVLLHGGKLTRFQSINVTLVIHRENKKLPAEACTIEGDHWQSAADDRDQRGVINRRDAHDRPDGSAEREQRLVG